MVKSINSTANVIRTQNSVVSPKELLNISSFSLERVTEMDPEFLNTDGEHMSRDASGSFFGVHGVAFVCFLMSGLFY